MAERIPSHCHNVKLYDVTHEEKMRAFPNIPRIYSTEYVEVPEGISYWEQITGDVTVCINGVCPNVGEDGECKLGENKPRSCQSNDLQP